MYASYCTTPEYFQKYQLIYASVQKLEQNELLMKRKARKDDMEMILSKTKTISLLPANDGGKCYSTMNEA